VSQTNLQAKTAGATVLSLVPSSDKSIYSLVKMDEGEEMLIELRFN
jgi:hypothetical protein